MCGYAMWYVLFFWIEDFVEIKKPTPHTYKIQYLHKIKERRT